MAEYQELVVHWQKKEQIEDFKKVKWGNEDVLYQIYGDHHIYGRDILLYIGITSNIDSRFKAHLKGVFGYVNNLSISIGRINNHGNPEIPESILIANHKPSFNKEFIHDLPVDAKRSKIIVINNGHCGMLQTCCTNFWWVDSNK